MTNTQSSYQALIPMKIFNIASAHTIPSFLTSFMLLRFPSSSETRRPYTFFRFYLFLEVLTGLPSAILLCVPDTSPHFCQAISISLPRVTLQTKPSARTRAVQLNPRVSLSPAVNTCLKTTCHLTPASHLAVESHHHSWAHLE